MADRKRFLLRIDPELYRALERWAADDLRSVNAQIEFLLKSAVDGAGRTPRRRAVTAPQGGRVEDGRAGEGGAEAPAAERAPGSDREP